MYLGLEVQHEFVILDGAAQRVSRSSRASDCAFISAVKKRKASRPASLARYMAVSAYWISVSGSSPSSG
jgi:hypothetical protein